MGDMREYYRQVSEIQKAVRESDFSRREIHRLQLEKQILMKTHKREKRYAELQDKLKELHKDLIREELEATQRFQSLLAQVDAVRREHQLLAAHTERLRQRKRQYEMHMASTNLDHQYKIQSDQYHTFQNSAGATRVDVPQHPSSTLIANPPLFHPANTQQSHAYPVTSSVASTSSHWPPGGYLPHGQMGYPAYGQQLVNQTGTHHQGVDQQGAFIPFKHSQADGKTNVDISSPMKSGATHFFNPSAQYDYLRNLNAEENCVSDIRAPAESGEFSKPLNEAKNMTNVSYDSNGYNPARHVKSNAAFHNPLSAVQSPKDSVLDTAETALPQPTINPISLMTQDMQHLSQHSHPLHNTAQNNQMGNAITEEYLPSRPTPPFSINSTYGSPTVPTATIIHSLPDSMEISKHLDPESSSQETLTHKKPSDDRLSDVLGHETAARNDEIVHQTLFQATNENECILSETRTSERESERKSSADFSEKNIEQDHLNSDSIEGEALGEHNVPVALNNQPLLLQPSSRTMYNESNAKEQIGKNGKENVEMSANGKISENKSEIISANVSNFEGEINEAASTINTKNGLQRIRSESLPDSRENELPVHAANDNISTSPVARDNSPALPNEQTSKVNSISSDNIPGNNDTILITKEKHGNAVSTISMEPKEKTPQPSVVCKEEEETGHLRSDDELGKTSYQSLESKLSTPKLDSPEKLLNQYSSGEIIDSGMTYENRSKVLNSETLSQDQEEDDSDFFDRDIPVTGSTAYKSVVGETRVGARSLLSTESDNDDVEGQMSSILSKQQNQSTRSTFKPFASSIPSLRPRPPETDTDSVDSVEAAIQAAMKNKNDQPATATASAQAQQRPSSTPQDLPLKPYTELSKETIKPGVGINPSKPRTSAAIQLNLASDSESCGVSAGEDGSDEDDFDFYDKL
nr:uncharacterized protein LOC123754027 isoform X2 [Procambarus clarkii]XP_045592100.1 uncharacterized protein LOC123754027 isoform X2 [Procambarus clarkii]